MALLPDVPAAPLLALAVAAMAVNVPVVLPAVAAVDLVLVAAVLLVVAEAVLVVAAEVVPVVLVAVVRQSGRGVVVATAKSSNQ